MDVNPPIPPASGPGAADDLREVARASATRADAPAPATGAPAGADRSEQHDEVVVSLDARRLARLEADGGLDAQARTELVEELRQQVEAGTYRPDPQTLARLMHFRGDA